MFTEDFEDEVTDAIKHLVWAEEHLREAIEKLTKLAKEAPQGKDTLWDAQRANLIRRQTTALIVEMNERF